jgi:carboxylesterase type B
MSNVPLDNHLKPLILSTDEVHLKGFLSKNGVANFLNLPYAEVAARFKTAVPIAISDLPRNLDVSEYGPKCPQKSDPLQHAMSHVFERVSLSKPGDESNCLHLNIYCPPASLVATRISKLPVFVWIHGGAFNIGDNSTQFGMSCLWLADSYSPLRFL